MTGYHAPLDAPKTDLECARFVRDRLLEAMDNWPDVIELNNSFAQISLEHTAISRWIERREIDRHD
jgi:hypothetical protein